MNLRPDIQVGGYNGRAIELLISAWQENVLEFRGKEVPSENYNAYLQLCSVISQKPLSQSELSKYENVHEVDSFSQKVEKFLKPFLL